MKEAIAQFKIYLEQRYPKRSTAKHYVSDLEIFRQFVGHISPRDITAKMIDQFIYSQSQQGLKAATINRRLASLSSFFVFLIDEAEDESWSNPVRWKRHAVKAGRHLPRDLNDETVRQLFAVIDDVRDRAIFSLMLSAGLRVGEIVQLQLSDLAQVETSLLSRLRVQGKGDKQRVAWLTTEALRPVQRWLQQRPHSQSNHLFLNQHAQPLTVSGVQYRLKQYCQKAQLQVSCHQLRHTFARRLAEQDMPLDSLAKVLGHANLKTTQLYIDGADPTVRRQFLKAMEQVGRFEADTTPTAHNSTVMAQDAGVSPSNPERLEPLELVKHLSHLMTDLPLWLQPALRDHLLRCIPGWQPHQARLNAHNHLAGLCRTARWLVQQRHWSALAQLQRTDLLAFVQASLQRGLKPQSVNVELKRFRRFWRELLAQELVCNESLLRVKAPPASSDPLPRYLTPAQFQRLEQVVLSETQADRPADRFDRAWFYLLAHTGLRRGELLNLRLADCDLTTGRLRVQAGKGNRDRVVPMTDHLITLLQAYLAVRQPAATDHLLIHRGAPVSRFVIARRLANFGLKAEISGLSPHRLRHTLATLLVNQGMPITSLQKLLGHQDINKTLIYARVHDETVCQHFAAAMSKIEAIPVADWPTQLEPLAAAGTFSFSAPGGSV